MNLIPGNGIEQYQMGPTHFKTVYCPVSYTCKQVHGYFNVVNTNPIRTFVYVTVMLA